MKMWIFRRETIAQVRREKVSPPFALWLHRREAGVPQPDRAEQPPEIRGDGAPSSPARPSQPGLCSRRDGDARERAGRPPAPPSRARPLRLRALPPERERGASTPRPGAEEKSDGVRNSYLVLNSSSNVAHLFPRLQIKSHRCARLRPPPPLRADLSESAALRRRA